MIHAVLRHCAVR